MQTFLNRQSVQAAQSVGMQVQLPKDITDVTADQIRILRAALVESGMLLIRNRQFSPLEQIALTKMFGYELHRVSDKQCFLPDYREVLRVSNQTSHGNLESVRHWHSDGHHLQDPSAVTVLHNLKAAKNGDTRVIDAARAYEALPKNVRSYLSNLYFLNLQTGVAHPIVRQHPVTKRPCLYVNLNAMAINEAYCPCPTVVGMLNQSLSMPGIFYQHQWQEGDTMILDNFATIFSETHCDPSYLRVMHKTSVTGPSVWWRYVLD